MVEGDGLGASVTCIGELREDERLMDNSQVEQAGASQPAVPRNPVPATDTVAALIEHAVEEVEDATIFYTVDIDVCRGRWRKILSTLLERVSAADHPCGGTCNPFMTDCGARFCHEHEMSEHNAECQQQRHRTEERS